MALYTLADPHLSFGTDKPMDIFGGAWHGYVSALRENLSVLREGDTLVIPGDLSWGINLEQAEPDFRFLASFPGRKILVKGNHDLWWSTVTKMRGFLEEKGLENFEFLHNNCFFFEGVALCGTRGWFFEEEKGEAHDAKILNRELSRLRASLEAAKRSGAERIFCFMHYPPVFGSYVCEPVCALLQRYGVERLYYGHLHAHSHRHAFTGLRGGVHYTLVSADYLKFAPLRIEL